MRNLSSFSLPDEVNDDSDGNGHTSVWRLDAPLWRLDESSQLDFSRSELWNYTTQRLVDSFRSNLDLCRLRICQKCNRTQPDFFSSDTAEQECGLCINKPIARFGPENNMDPGEVSNIERCILIEKVPDELKGLSQLEEMLIARIYPLITVYTVKGGQRKGSKHVINFPQNLNRLATQLPRLPGDITLVVRLSNRQEDQHYDFRVRRDKVRATLVWL